MKIEALHEFHDLEFSKGWADRFDPSPPRIDLFKTIVSQISNYRGKEEIHILELGIGPGYLAEFLFENLDNFTYEGLDFSEAMLSISKNRLRNFESKIVFIQADLTNGIWNSKISKKPDFIISTWALHDLFSKENIGFVYIKSFEALGKGGVLLNGDFIKPHGIEVEYEGGRIEKMIHFQLLAKAGFSKISCLKDFEKDHKNPTTSNNYCCFEAIKL